MNLADVLARKLNEPRMKLRTATVAGATATRATVTLAGATVPDVPFLSSYTPSVGHVVLILQFESQLIIIGRAA